MMPKTGRRPRILLTTGEPAGIGPDLVIQLSQIEHDHDLTVIGAPDLLLARARTLSMPLNIVPLKNLEVVPSASGKTSTLNLLPVPLRTTVSPGVLDIGNAQYVLDVLDIACNECLAERFDAVVTTPLQKSIINDAGITFSGHTEYLAARCGGVFPVMLLAAPDLRVALVTTHLPLRAVADAITAERMEAVLRIILEEMPQRFGICEPRLAVCGLNPHAGEDGHLGTEEKEVIIPVIDKLAAEGNQIVGPLPADTAFRLEQRQKTDVFVCLYHDQGLPVLKTLGFGKIVNITLGLPIIRTSVDHGTALELAGTGKSKYDSLLAAIDMAEIMSCNQNAILSKSNHDL